MEIRIPPLIDGRDKMPSSLLQTDGPPVFPRRPTGTLGYGVRDTNRKGGEKLRKPLQVYLLSPHCTPMINRSFIPTSSDATSIG